MRDCSLRPDLCAEVRGKWKAKQVPPPATEAGLDGGRDSRPAGNILVETFHMMDIVSDRRAFEYGVEDSASG